MKAGLSSKPVPRDCGQSPTTHSSEGSEIRRVSRCIEPRRARRLLRTWVELVHHSIPRWPWSVELVAVVVRTHHTDNSARRAWHSYQGSKRDGRTCLISAHRSNCSSKKKICYRAQFTKSPFRSPVRIQRRPLPSPLDANRFDHFIHSWSRRTEGLAKIKT